jgi:hypothetical protein
LPVPEKTKMMFFFIILPLSLWVASCAYLQKVSP